MKTQGKVRSVLATNIRMRRKQKKWSAQKLAEIAEIPYPTLRDVELDYHQPRKETVAAIAKALECEVEDLYQREIKTEWTELTAKELNGLLGRFISENEDLKSENAQLKAEIERLRRNYLESAAEAELSSVTKNKTGRPKSS